MRKALFFALLAMFFVLSSQQAFADDLTLNPVNKGEWKIQDSSGKTIGTLKKIEDEAFSVQLAAGDYLGIILKTGELRKTTRHPVFTEMDARLYLDLLKAIKKIK
jgi:hypothetical protein